MVMRCSRHVYMLRSWKLLSVLQQGEAKLAKWPLCLARQGIGTEEVAAFSPLLEEDGLLRQLAGNAFCANVWLVLANRCTLVLVMVNAHSLALQIKEGCNREHDVRSCGSKPHCKLF